MRDLQKRKRCNRQNMSIIDVIPMINYVANSIDKPALEDLCCHLLKQLIPNFLK